MPATISEPTDVSLFRAAVTNATDAKRQAEIALALLGGACLVEGLCGAAGNLDRARATAGKAVQIAGDALRLAQRLHGAAASAFATITGQVRRDAREAFARLVRAGTGSDTAEPRAIEINGEIIHGLPDSFQADGGTLEDLQASLGAMECALAALPGCVARIDRLQRAGDAVRRIVTGESTAIL